MWFKFCRIIFFIWRFYKQWLTRRVHFELVLAKTICDVQSYKVTKQCKDYQEWFWWSSFFQWKFVDFVNVEEKTWVWEIFSFSTFLSKSLKILLVRKDSKLLTVLCGILWTWTADKFVACKAFLRLLLFWRTLAESECRNSMKRFWNS